MEGGKSKIKALVDSVSMRVLFLACRGLTPVVERERERKERKGKGEREGGGR